MFEIYVILFTFFSSILINFFLLRKDFLLDAKYSFHKSLLSKNKTPLSGGIIILLSISIFYVTEIYTFKLILLVIFLIGVLSDLNIISSPTKRIVAQFSVTLIFLYINQIFIHSTRWEFLDYYLQNTYVGYIFSLLCLVVLINGTNFMDGVNTLVIGYYLAISLIVLYLANNFNLDINFQLTKIILATLFILWIFNFFGKLFLGDSGSYLISFIFGYMLINFSNENEIVSPYFIACMLWYPAFENLFSIIRKINKNNSPIRPDNKHLHQLLFVFIKSKLTYSNNILNTLTGLIINLFNWSIFLYAASNFNNTKQLLILILISVIFYNFFYYFLLKKVSSRID